MAPPRNTRVGPETLRHIIAYFGSMSAFQRQFSEAAIQVEASGWAILVWQPAWSRLEILTAEKHQDLTQWGGIPVLVLDVWEHVLFGLSKPQERLCACVVAIDQLAGSRKTSAPGHASADADQS